VTAANKFKMLESKLITLGQAETMVAAERERWKHIADAAQAVTTGGDDRFADLDGFVVPSHLMAALALALDEGPNVAIEPRR
jgi:hypothetical protein